MKEQNLRYGMERNFRNILGAIVVPTIWLVLIMFALSKVEFTIDSALSYLMYATLPSVVLWGGGLLIGIKFLWNLSYGTKSKITIIIIYTPLYFIIEFLWVLYPIGLMMGGAPI